MVLLYKKMKGKANGEEGRTKLCKTLFNGPLLGRSISLLIRIPIVLCHNRMHCTLTIVCCNWTHNRKIFTSWLWLELNDAVVVGDVFTDELEKEF